MTDTDHMKRTLTVVGLIGMASAAAVAGAKALIVQSARRPAAEEPPLPDSDVGHQLNQAVERFREAFGA